MFKEWIGRNITFNNRDKEYSFELFENSILPNERIYEGILDIDLVEASFSSYDLLRSVFTNRQFSNLSDLDTLDYKQFIRKYHELYFLGKLCYLLNDYLKTNSFKYPISIFYNPRTGKNNVHPGIGRTAIHKLLSISAIRCYYFNTGGIQLKDVGIMNFGSFVPTTLREIHHKSDGRLLPRFTLDHGSMIPQLTFDNDQEERETRTQFAKNIIKSLPDFNFDTNINLDFGHEHINPLSKTKIIFNNFYTQQDIARGIIFALLGQSRIFDNVRIFFYD